MPLQPTPPPAPNPTPTAYILPRAAPKPLLMDRVVVILGVTVGALIAVGLLSYHAIYLLAPACYGFGCPTPPPPTPAQILAQNLAWVFVVTMDLAVALSVCVAFLVGGTQNNLSDSMKRGTSYFAMVFLAVWLIFGTTALSGLAYIIRYL